MEKVFGCMFIAWSALLLVGCRVGPDYHRPALQVPDTFRAPDATPATDSASLANLKWWQVFQDDQLQALVRTALAQNYDLRDAVARVDEARAVLGVARSDQAPHAAGGGDVQITRLSRNASFPLPPAILPAQDRNWGEARLGLLSFELDVWGRLRRATEGARANLLAAEENRKAVVTTLVSSVASDYFLLRQLDSELEIAQRTLAARQESLRLLQARQKRGVGNLLELRQGEQLVDTAAAGIPLIQRQIEQTENQISLLLGMNPDSIVRGKSLTEQQSPPEVPVGLPSALIERRPDILAAEQDLITANSQIGMAKAAYFPQLSLTGFAGGQSTQLASLFSGPARAWNFVPTVTQPVFTAGRLRSNVRIAEARRQRAVVHYQQTIQTAFTEVSDAIIARQRVHEGRVQQELLVAALDDRKRVAYVRYRGGVDSLLSALDADRDLFQAELTLSRLRLDELLSLIQLYKALGGGWK